MTGDVIKGPILAHVLRRRHVCRNFSWSGHVNYDVISGVIYTSPEVATVGKTEEQLKKKTKRIRWENFLFSKFSCKS